MEITGGFYDNEEERLPTTCPVCEGVIIPDGDTGRTTCGCGTFTNRCEECGQGFNGPGAVCNRCLGEAAAIDD